MWTLRIYVSFSNLKDVNSRDIFWKIRIKQETEEGGLNIFPPMMNKQIYQTGSVGTVIYFG